MKNGIYKFKPIKLAEGNPVEQVSNQVQLMRTCTFFHKEYGKVEITRQLFDEMIRNHVDNVRGIEVFIDYSHETHSIAAGCIKSIEVREMSLGENLDGEQRIEHQLWATVEWTPKGRKVLSDKEFAYLSADFDPNYKDNENPTQYVGAVLLGAGLTNRPVIKRMNPAIQLSEFSETTTNEENFDMTIEEMQKQLDSNKIKLSEHENDMKEKEKSLSEHEAKLAQIDSLMSQMGVSSIEELMTKIKEMSKANVELAESKESAEKETKLNKLLSEGKISQAQKEKALTLEKESFSGFISLAEMNEQTVKLSESGNAKTPTESINVDVDGIEDKVLELAEEKAKKDEIEMTDAISLVLSEDKELAAKYYKLGE